MTFGGITDTQDLIGSCPLAGAKSADNVFTQRPGSNRLRRAHSQQLISLNRIISDLAGKHEKKVRAACSVPGCVRAHNA